jgi:cytochrome c biogenesis factor
MIIQFDGSDSHIVNVLLTILPFAILAVVATGIIIFFALRKRHNQTKEVCAEEHKKNNIVFRTGLIFIIVGIVISVLSISFAAINFNLNNYKYYISIPLLIIGICLIVGTKAIKWWREKKDGSG